MLTPACTHCADTGSTQKRLDCDFLDCTHCGVASERMALEAWAADAAGIVHGGVAALWLIYLHGKAAGAAPLLVALRNICYSSSEAEEYEAIAAAEELMERSGSAT